MMTIARPGRARRGVLFAAFLLLCLFLTVGIGAPTAQAAAAKPNFQMNFTTDDPSLAYTESMFREQFEEVYPKLVKRFNPDAPRTVTLQIKYVDGVASTDGAVTTISSSYMHSHNDLAGVYTHEFMHTVQAYPEYVVWLTEGIADYVRYVYGPKDDPWSLPTTVTPEQSYKQGYGVTARFLLWMEKHVRSTIVDDANRVLHAGTYSDDDFVTWTGQTLDYWWSYYVQHPEI